VSFAAVMLPLFVEVILTFGLLFWTGALRNGDLRAGTVKPEDIGLRELNWPRRTAQVGNAYSNQTELPTLFYALTILAYFTHHAGVIFVVLAWTFVAFRMLHAYVHVTSNIPSLRGMLFGFGTVVLSVMWAIFIVEVLITDGTGNTLF
jgi:hypothetical protein